VRTGKLWRLVGAIVAPPKLVIRPDGFTNTMAADLPLSPFVWRVPSFALVSFFSLPNPSPFSVR
jgi:hypothetical protein